MWVFIKWWREYFQGYLHYPAYLVLLISLPAYAADKPVLTLVTSDVSNGFYHSKAQTGLLDQVLELALERMGYRLKVLTVPTQRSLKMAEAGLADGELVRTRAIEVSFPSLLRVPEPLLEGQFAIFANKSAELKASWAALAGQSVGIVIGMKIIENNVPEDARVIRVKNEEQLFLLLQRKRIDYAVYMRDPGKYYLHQNNIEGIVSSGMGQGQVYAYTYLHPKHGALVPKLAEALRGMKQDGSYQALLDQHTQLLSLPAGDSAAVGRQDSIQ